MELAGVALVGANAALRVTLVAVGTVGLLALDGAAGQIEQDAALGVGQIVAGRSSVAGTDQMARQAVIIQLTGEDTGTRVGQFLQATIGVGDQAGCAATGRAFEDPIARCIIYPEGKKKNLSILFPISYLLQVDNLQTIKAAHSYHATFLS